MSKKKNPKEKAREEAEGRKEQEAIRKMLATLPTTLFKDRTVFDAAIEKAARAANLKPPAPVRKAILSALSERDETAEICRDSDGYPEPDPELRDTENVPLSEGLEAYFEREVKPYAALDASARVNTRENVRLTFDQKVEDVIQEIVDSNFDLYKRITDDRVFGESIKNLLFDIYLRSHRQAAELLKQHESKTLEFKSTLRWNLKENRKDPAVTNAVIKTIAAFLNTEGGDVLIGVSDDRSVLGIEADAFENEDKFMLHLSQVVRNALGDRAGTCVDPRMQIVKGKTVCVVTCQRRPEPVFMKTKEMLEAEKGEFYVRSGPGTIRLSPEDSEKYIATRFAKARAGSE